MGECVNRLGPTYELLVLPALPEHTLILHGPRHRWIILQVTLLGNVMSPPHFQ